MQKILLADRQDITRAGMQFVCLGMNDVDTKYVEDKAELILSLKESPEAVVVLDYTLFDFNDADELLIFNLRSYSGFREADCRFKQSVFRRS